MSSEAGRRLRRASVSLALCLALAAPACSATPRVDSAGPSARAPSSSAVPGAEAARPAPSTEGASVPPLDASAIHASDPPAAPSPCGAPVPEMACIPAGPFVRGSADGPAEETPQTRVVLDAYFMDVTEVTVEAFDACVAARRCKPARTIYSDFSRAKQPKVGVRWFDARDYCLAMGKHLPTEAEWEKAARGEDGRRYPWGDAPATCERAVIMDASGRGCGIRKEGGEPEKGRTSEVASRPANPYGLFDMAGNAWEWVSDWYAPSYAACGEACAGPNPRGPCGGADTCPGHTERVVRGGSWYWDGSYATTTHRSRHWPSNDPYHHYGFRCAASLTEAAALAAK